MSIGRHICRVWGWIWVGLLLDGLDRGVKGEVVCVARARKWTQVAALDRPKSIMAVNHFV